MHGCVRAPTEDAFKENYAAAAFVACMDAAMLGCPDHADAAVAGRSDIPYAADIDSDQNDKNQAAVSTTTRRRSVGASVVVTVVVGAVVAGGA